VHNLDAVGCCHNSVKTSERINLGNLSLRRDSIETNVWYCSCIDCEFFGCCVPSQPRGLSSDWTTVKRERMSICVWEVACWSLYNSQSRCYKGALVENVRINTGSLWSHCQVCDCTLNDDVKVENSICDITGPWSRVDRQSEWVGTQLSRQNNWCMIDCKVRISPVHPRLAWSQDSCDWTDYNRIISFNIGIYFYCLNGWTSSWHRDYHIDDWRRNCFEDGSSTRIFDDHIKVVSDSLSINLCSQSHRVGANVCESCSLDGHKTSFFVCVFCFWNKAQDRS